MFSNNGVVGKAGHGSGDGVMKVPVTVIGVGKYVVDILLLSGRVLLLLSGRFGGRLLAEEGVVVVPITVIVGFSRRFSVRGRGNSVHCGGFGSLLFVPWW